MKVLCGCGHIIVDQTDDVPGKAWLVAAEQLESLWDRVSDELAKPSFTSDRGAWIRDVLGAEYPSGLSSKDAIRDFLTGASLPSKRAVYECPVCGRVLIENGGGDAFSVYRRELPVRTYAEMKTAGATQQQVWRQAERDGVSAVDRARLLHAVFGLALDEAKSAAAELLGRALTPLEAAIIDEDFSN